MGDIVDDANDSLAKELHFALLHHQNRNETKTNKQDNSVKYCVDCGTLIPEARLKIVPGTLRCVKCQTNFERRN